MPTPAAFDWTILATLNASLNALAFVLIVAGLLAIKARRERAHKRLMLAAATVSALFLVSYSVYHLAGEEKHFEGPAALRPYYYGILISHVILATVQVPLILMTIVSGLRDRRPRHRRLAKITAPIWLYVSITGVVIYFMLYHP